MTQASAPLIPALASGELHQTSLTIKRSTFITHIGQCSDTAAAREGIERVRSRYADATHNCWAFVACPAGSTAQVGCSDDGEPHGTAGRPMLTTLLHSGVGEIFCVVTRYFGGIKLGTGGLVRAYQQSVALCLESLPVCPKTELARVMLEVAYADSDRVHRLLPACLARVVQEEYDQAMILTVELPADRVSELALALADATCGRVLLLADDLS